MTWKILPALAAVAAALWLLWPSSSERAAPPRDEPAAKREADRGASVPTYARPTQTRVERPRLHVPSTEDAPRVAVDCRPWDPERETRGAHERRTRVADAFDRFVEETGMSEERAQELLRLLYGYQERFRAIEAEYEGIKPFRDERQRDLYRRKLGSDWRLLAIETEQQLRGMLSDDEMRAWRTFERAGFWTVLRDPVIQPVEGARS